MAFKKNTVSTNIESYVHYIRGVKKCGKTTFFRDLILKLYGVEDDGLLLTFGNERGHESLDRIQFEEIREWDMNENEVGERGFIQVVDELISIAGKTSIKLIGFDTIDKLIEIGTPEILKQSVRETGKPCKSLNAAFGGYQEGHRRLGDMINQQTDRLLRAGYGIFVFGHTKYKSKKDERTGEEYDQLTTSLMPVFDSIFGDTAQMVATISVDKIIEENKLLGTKTMLHFRDDGVVDCGCRFKHLPDAIEFSVENYLNVFYEAVKMSFLTQKTDKELEKIRATELAERNKKAEKASENDVPMLVLKVKEAMRELQKARGAKEANPIIMKALNSQSLNSPDEISIKEQAAAILEFIVGSNK